MRTLLCAAMTATLLAAGSAAGEDKLYKWVDEDGRVTYQDRPPPDASGQVQAFDQSLEESDSPGQRAALPEVDITLYSIEVCDACDLVRELLNERGLPFTEKNADNDIEVQEELKEVSGVLSVPVLAIGDEVLTGFNRDLILRVLEDVGFPTTVNPEARPSSEQASSASGRLTPEEMEETARNVAGDDDPFDEDFFSDSEPGTAGDDISQWEEIPEEEQIRVGE